MAEPQQQAQLQGATEMVKVDITLLAAQTRAWGGMLFRAISRGDRDVKSAFNGFIESFWQLYFVIKDNAAQTGKIPDWKEKQAVYDDMFFKIMGGAFMPVTMLKLYGEFAGDLRACGIYDLSAGEWVQWC
jgi:hypothetical protein